MRLTCPNCAAQYEVPDDVIPEEGRDVQCSNCGTTWFQAGSGAADDQQAPAPEAFEEERPDHAPQEADLDSPAPEPEPENEGFDQPEPQPEPEPEHEAVEPAPATEAAPRQQRGLDPSLSDILREEAEREASLRAAASSASAQGLESQPNLGLDDLPDDDSALRARQAKDRMARLHGQDPRQLAAEESGQRRDILPDIEEINSTLRAGDTAASAPQPTSQKAEEPRKSGFARGFALTILLFLVLLMIYTNAGKIAETMPQADPYLSAYVTWVDQARLWLDAQVKALQQPEL